MADLTTHHQPAVAAAVVLVLDDDAEIGNLISDVLTGEGYTVALGNRRGESVADAVQRIGPDCVLLDGAVPGSYGESWADAAWMSTLPTPVPVIMFSASRGATDEARLNLSSRSQAAGFSGVIAKPFELDDLLRVVEAAVSRPPFRIDN